MASTNLTNRLARIEGQTRALKTKIETNQIDCVETIRQVKTISQAIKKFGEAYLLEYMKTCMSNKTNKATIEQELNEVIKSLTQI